MSIPWYWVSAVLMVVTALTHSILGERRLIGPLMHMSDGILARPLARPLLRFSWHFLSALMIICAIVVAWPQTSDTINFIIGATWLGVGLFDLVMTRGKHVGWPMLALAGLAAVIGAV